MRTITSPRHEVDRDRRDAFPSRPSCWTTAYRAPWTPSVTTPMRQRQPDRRRLTDDAEGRQQERRDRRPRGRGNRPLAPGDGAHLGPVEPPAPLDALREHMGVQVRDPEDQHGHRDDDREPPGVRVVALVAGRHGGHHDDRAVDRPGDPAGGPEEQAPGSSLLHRRDSAAPRRTCGACVRGVGRVDRDVRGSRSVAAIPTTEEGRHVPQHPGGGRWVAARRSGADGGDRPGRLRARPADAVHGDRPRGPRATPAAGEAVVAALEAAEAEAESDPPARPRPRPRRRARDHGGEPASRSCPR